MTAVSSRLNSADAAGEAGPRESGTGESGPVESELGETGFGGVARAGESAIFGRIQLLEQFGEGIGQRFLDHRVVQLAKTTGPVGRLRRNAAAFLVVRWDHFFLVHNAAMCSLDHLQLVQTLHAPGLALLAGPRNQIPA